MPDLDPAHVEAVAGCDPHQLALFHSRVETDGDCWLWTGHINPEGYGIIYYPPKQRERAHRWAYKAFVGPIPAGLILDHLCRVRRCVNPAHLEPVTDQENIRRGEAGLNLLAAAAAVEFCPRGHRYDQDNTFTGSAGHRNCRQCMSDRNAQDAECPKCGRVRARRTVATHLKSGCPEPGNSRSYRQDGRTPRRRYVTRWESSDE